MNKFFKTLLITAFLTFSMVLSVFAEVPGPTINENFISESTTKIEDNDYFITSINAQNFGSNINVQLSDKGAISFANACKYQVFTKNMPRTARVNLCKPTTIFPSKVAGDVVDIMLYDINDRELELVANVVLGGIPIEKRTLSGTISLPNGETAPQGGIEIKIYPIEIGINNTIEWLDYNSVKIESGKNSVVYSIKINPNAKYIINYQMNDKSLNYIQRGFYGVTGMEYNTFNASPVAVTEEDINNINMIIEPSKDIRGIISLPDGEYAPEGGIQVQLTSWMKLNDNRGIIDHGYFNIEKGKNYNEFILKVKADSEYKLEYKSLIEHNSYSGYYNSTGTVTSYNDASPIVVKQEDVLGLDFHILKTESKNYFDINVITKPEILNAGDDAKIVVRAVNNTNETKTTMLIIALYDENNRFINYVAVKQYIKPQESIDLTGCLKVLPEGKKVKCFVWDSFENMNPLSDSIEIPVN